MKDRDGEYRPQLDSLRAIAVSMVLLVHFWLTETILGSIGVRLFFVLSGFLITDILIRMRGGDGAFQTRPAAWWIFFVRRALRLWPAYYLLLGLALLTGIQNMRETAAWHLFYATNILFVIEQQFYPWIVAHWWTLGIEQQFYLIWPFLMLLPPRRALGGIMWATIAATALFMTAAAQWSNNAWLGMLLPGSMDALAAGGLLSLAVRDRSSAPRWLWILALVSIPLIVGLLFAGMVDWKLSMAGLPPMMLAVALAHFGIGGLPGKLLGARPIVAMGRVSYGIYLYHLFVLYSLRRAGQFIPALDHTGPALLAVGAPVTIVVALLSWRFLEAPANRLKRFFPYSPQRVAPVASASPLASGQ